MLIKNDRQAKVHLGNSLIPHDPHSKEPKSFGNKRNRITDAHRSWIEERYRNGWKQGYADEQVKIFRREEFAYHKVSVVSWQFDEYDQPATVTEPYEKAFTATNLEKEAEKMLEGLTR